VLRELRPHPLRVVLVAGRGRRVQCGPSGSPELACPQPAFAPSAVLLFVFCSLRLGPRRASATEPRRQPSAPDPEVLPLVSLPACFDPALRVRMAIRSHAGNGWSGLHRDPLHCLLVRAPRTAWFPRFGVEQMTIRRRDRRRQLDDAALLVRVGGAFVSRCFTPPPPPAFRGKHSEHFPFLCRDWLARDYAAPCRLRDVASCGLWLSRSARMRLFL